MYIINSTDPDMLFVQYHEDMNVILHATLLGPFNFWAVTKEKIDVEGDIVAEGWRSDYHVTFASNHSWEEAIQIMVKKAEIFNPKEYIPRNIIKTHCDETIKWSADDETLYREFKFNMRKKLKPITDQHSISTWKIHKFMNRLPECCTVFTKYFPKMRQIYKQYLFVVETDYEDFVIDVFSELPTSCTFFKVSDKLFMYADVDLHIMRYKDRITEDFRIYLPSFAKHLLKKGILKSTVHTVVDYLVEKRI
jgi:hypothetical protein